MHGYCSHTEDGLSVDLCVLEAVLLPMEKRFCPARAVHDAILPLVIEILSKNIGPQLPRLDGIKRLIRRRETVFSCIGFVKHNIALI